jgi:hypothetical protein
LKVYLYWNVTLAQYYKPGDFSMMKAPSLVATVFSERHLTIDGNKFISPMERRAVLKNPLREPIRKFSLEEDSKLNSLVGSLGINDWVRIALEMNGRSARQCRERWQNYLRPDINRTEWTKEEEELMVAKYTEFGPCWRRIAQFLESRTDIDIKNCWNRRQRRLQRQSLGPGEQMASDSGPILWTMSDFDHWELDFP